MPFIDTSKLKVIERKPGWFGRYFHSPNMTFAHYEFKKGSTVHEHFHEQEEVWQFIEGKLEITIDGVKETGGPGFAGIVRPMSLTRSRLSPTARQSSSIIRCGPKTPIQSLDPPTSQQRTNRRRTTVQTAKSNKTSSTPLFRNLPQ